MCEVVRGALEDDVFRAREAHVTQDPNGLLRTLGKWYFNAETLSLSARSEASEADRARDGSGRDSVYLAISRSGRT